MRIFACFMALLFTGLEARAEDLYSAPGWSLNKITETKNEENTYSDARVYYSLKPPDSRPAISVDSRTADRIRSGEASAESIYAGQTKNSDKKDDEEFVWGKHGNGIVVADPVNSTLTSEDGRKAGSAEPVAQSQSFHPASGSSLSGLQGFSGASSGSSSSNASGASRPPAQAAAAGNHNGTGASAPPPGSAAAASAGGGSVFDDPRKIASAENKASPDANKRFVGGGIVANNVAAGFGVPPNSTSTDTNFVVWPDGEPGKKKGDEAPKCSQSQAKTFDQPTLARFSVPAGCNNVRVRAWGAGGGSGLSGANSEGASFSAEGGGGAYVYTEGQIDTSKYDLVVVVGSAGGDANGSEPGKPGFLSGGKGGAGGGGGGGGYSGLFLVDKARFKDGEKPQLAEMAIAVAAGGGGGSATGVAGGGGGVEKGGGVHGASQGGGGNTAGKGHKGSVLQGGDAGDAGGGGGGGFFGGGGGGGTDTDTAQGGGGGSSYWRFLNDESTGMKASGATAGNADFKPRGKAGNAGKAGLVILEFF